MRSDCKPPLCDLFLFWIQEPFFGFGVPLDRTEVAWPKSSIRVLVVDDFEPFRRSICSALQDKLELRTNVEASDGQDAIELAQALQPDLILMDIGLPKLDGIKAARRISELAPKIENPIF